MGATTPDVVDANDVAAVDRKTTPDVVDANNGAADRKTTPDVVDANNGAADRRTTPDVVDANDVVTEDKKTLLKPSVSSTWSMFLACSFGIKVFIFFRG